MNYRVLFLLIPPRIFDTCVKEDFSDDYKSEITAPKIMISFFFDSTLSSPIPFYFEKPFNNEAKKT